MIKLEVQTETTIPFSDLPLGHAFLAESFPGKTLAQLNTTFIDEVGDEWNAIVLDDLELVHVMDEIQVTPITLKVTREET